MAGPHGTNASTAGLTAERIARNDAIFRAANERIREVAEANDLTERVPFICECADPACRDLLVLALVDYAEVRRDPRRFLNVPGHEAAAEGWVDVVGRHEGYVVVEKQGAAAKVVEQLEGVPHPETTPVDAGPAGGD